MAARTRKIRHDDETRAKIQTSQIINRLNGHILGKVNLSASQVSAAGLLLRKTLPDLVATELTGKDGAALFENTEFNTRDLARAIFAVLREANIEDPTHVVQQNPLTH